jgi:hypothetical protein
LSVERHAGDRYGKTRAQRCHTPDRLLHALRERTAKETVVDLMGLDAGTRDSGPQSMSGKRR